MTFHNRTVQETPPPPRKSVLDILFGPPLPDADDRERVGPAAGIAVFGLDALSSAAYGPEAALTILLVLGSVGIAYLLPITITIIVLLSVVYFSYRQTIAAYPGGGGSFTVASENLGIRVGLVAGAALLVDYILNVAVGISAGVGALVSAVPVLYPHTLALCLGILLILTVINLRGVREAGLIFTLPTYRFVACLGVVILIGVIQNALARWPSDLASTHSEVRSSSGHGQPLATGQSIFERLHRDDGGRSGKQWRAALS